MKWINNKKGFGFIIREDEADTSVSLAKAKSLAEIRKNSRVLAQATRCLSIFSNLPNEILIKIAGHTKTTFIHSQEEAEKIANSYFAKPTNRLK